MRQRATGRISGQAALAASVRPRLRRLARASVPTLSLLLLLAPLATFAEPAPSIDVAAPPPAALDFPGFDSDLDAQLDSDLDRVQPADVATDEAGVTDAADPAAVAAVRDVRRPVLDLLLTVREVSFVPAEPRSTDDALRAAVALGNNPDLEPKNPFRKRSRDLFRTERPVTIGDADMVLRLRLRAKTRRAMSVELRF